MKYLKNVGKRALALVLALMMCVGMLSTTAFAVDLDWLTCKHTNSYRVNCLGACDQAHLETWHCKDCNHDFSKGVGYKEHGHLGSTASNLVDGKRNDKEHSLVCTECHLIISTVSHSYSVANCTTPATCECGDVKGSKDPNNHANLQWHYNETSHWQECAACNNSGKVNEGSHNVIDGKCVCGYTETTVPPSECEHTNKIYTAVEGSNHASHTWTCAASGCDATGTVDGNVLNWTGADVSTLCPGQTTTHTALCTVCGSLVHKQVSGTGSHSYTKWAQAGTSGHIKQCEKCGGTQATSQGAHQVNAWEVVEKATCTKAGQEKGPCKDCGVMLYRPISALGHDYQDGICTRCGEKDPNYDFTCKHVNTRTETVAATCTSVGTVKTICVDCKSVLTTVVSTALGHDFSEMDEEDSRWKDPTCTEEGLWVYKCTREGCKETTTVVKETLFHNYGDKIEEVPATCGKNGEMAHYECADCHKLFVGTHEVKAEDLVIPATGDHTWSDWEAATDEHTGKECRECTVCGRHETRDPVTTTDPGTDPSETPSTSPSPVPTTPGTGDGGDVVIDDNDIPLGGDPDGGDGEVELDDNAIPLAGPVTRAEFVDYLYRREGSPEAGLSTFEDVSADHEYAYAIGWGQANDIAYGVSATEFLPDELVTVGQAKLFLSRYAKLKGIEMPELAALVGLDDQDYAMNCDEILGEFFGSDE